MNDQLKQLAETLKKTGMAASMYEAFEKAKSILNINSQKTDASQRTNEPQQNQETVATVNIGADIKNEDATLNELMKEANVNPAEIEAEEKQRAENIKADISELKQEIEHAEETPEKIEEIKEEVEEIKQEASELAEDKTEEQENIEQSNTSNEQQNQETEDLDKQPKQQNPEQEDIFKEEKKIDLTKVFNNNNQNN